MSEKIKRGYVYIGSLPHGFHEVQIRSYFKQFGQVMRIRLSRSKKTGNYRGYGFIEFESESVAKIAADTMNNYLMFNKLIKCKVIPKNQLHKMTFKNANRTFVPPVQSHHRRAYNSTKSKKDLLKAKENISIKLIKKQKKLEELGIDLNLNQVLGRSDTAIKANKNEEKLPIKQEIEQVEVIKRKSSSDEITKKPKKILTEKKEVLNDEKVGEIAQNKVSGNKQKVKKIKKEEKKEVKKSKKNFNKIK